jgi:hypothetical protein
MTAKVFVSHPDKVVLGFFKLIAFVIARPFNLVILNIDDLDFDTGGGADLPGLKVQRIAIDFIAKC